MQAVRIIEIPDCKMVSSGVGMFGEPTFDNFNAWFSTLPRTTHPKDFLFWDGPEFGVSGGFHWLYMHDEGMKVPGEFSVIDFKGGLYAVATDMDRQTDFAALDAEVDAFLLANGFKRDPQRPGLGNIITPPEAEKIMGFNQMDYYIPVTRAAKP